MNKILIPHALKCNIICFAFLIITQIVNRTSNEFYDERDFFFLKKIAFFLVKKAHIFLFFLNFVLDAVM